MMLEIVKTFVVKAPSIRVRDFLTDLPRVVDCMPGAAIGDPIGDSDGADSLIMTLASVGSGPDGAEGGADMEMTSTITELTPRLTEVTVASMVTVKGTLEHMQREMVDDVLDQVFQIFSERVRAEVEPAAHSTKPEPAALEEAPWRAASPPPFDATASWRRTAAVDLRSVGRAALGTVTAPAFWVAVSAIAAVLYLLFGR